jgi:hypothetical protein
MYNLMKNTINHLLSCLYGLKPKIPIEFLNIKENVNRTAKKITIIEEDYLRLQLIYKAVGSGGGGCPFV